VNRARYKGSQDCFTRAKFDGQSKNNANVDWPSKFDQSADEKHTKGEHVRGFSFDQSGTRKALAHAQEGDQLIYQQKLDFHTKKTVNSGKM
jgi:hypothetical protein